MTHPEPVRLLLVSGGRGPFGAPERVLWELATRLPESRYAASVWLPPEPALDELTQSLEERGIAVERRSEPRSRWDLAGRMGRISALRRLKPEILHLHAEAAGLHRGLPATAKAAGVPHVVVTHHGLPDGAPWRELGKADAVTAVCASAADRLVSVLGLPRDRVRVIANGADPPDDLSELPAARRLRDRLGVGAFRPLWVAAARLEEVKGQDVLIDALAENVLLAVLHGVRQAISRGWTSSRRWPARAANGAHWSDGSRRSASVPASTSWGRWSPSARYCWRPTPSCFLPARRRSRSRCSRRWRAGAWWWRAAWAACPK